MKDRETNGHLREVIADGPGARIYEYVRGDDSHSPLLKFAEKRANHEGAAKLLSTLRRIAEVGIGPSERLGFPLVKRLKGDIVEVRVSGTVIRAVSVHEAGSDVLVVLDVHRAHQGGSDMSEQIKLAKKVLPSVKALLNALKG